MKVLKAYLEDGVANVDELVDMHMVGLVDEHNHRQVEGRGALEQADAVLLVDIAPARRVHEITSMQEEKKKKTTRDKG